MGLLAESKSRKSIGKDPNNTKWARDTTTFGQKILRSQGWEPGQFLGAKDAPHSELHTAANASYIRVALKDDMKGLGFSKAKEDEVTGLDVFSDLLSRLNGKSEAQVDEAKAARLVVKTNRYLEQKWGPMRFVSGGLLVGDSMKELMSDPAESSDDKKKKEEESSATATATATTAAEKKSKKRKAEARDDSSSDSSSDEEERQKKERKKRRTEEKKAKKEAKEAKRGSKKEKKSKSSSESTSVEPSGEEGVAKKEDKADKKKSKKTSSKEQSAESDESSSNSSEAKEAKKSKKEKKKSKDEKKEKKKVEKKDKKKEKRRKGSKSDDSDSDASDAKASSSGKPTPAPSGTSTPTTLPHRNFVRSRFIAQKQRVLMDTEALKQILMVKT
ncbi:Protein PXR1 [Escovopsis weberi]|uniref:PinX1-related protein 1 n=1 Tax=Escovopsis weberi TaxID=150374 RepID=A0A0M8N003_ESCWE|nr:Protein PXR1 [Escovopsis weberi]